MDELRRWMESGRMVVFVGPGVSTLPPTNLPGWRMVNRWVAEALAEQATRFMMPPVARELGNVVARKIEANELPGKLFAKIIATRIGPAYFDVVRHHLDSDRPNAVHMAVAALAKAGRVGAVITTNFDGALEAAFARLDVPATVFATPNAFEAIGTDDAPIGRWNTPDSACPVFEIHGTPDTAAEMIGGVERMGLRPSVEAVLRRLLRDAHWLFLGYSGADLTVQPGFLGLRREHAQAVGLTWLVHPDVPPASGAVEIVALYGDRGRFVPGELPRWIDPLVADLDDEASITAIAACAVESAEEIPSAKMTAAQIREWGDRVGIVKGALALSDLLDATGQLSRASELASALHARISARPHEFSSAELAEVLDTVAHIRNQQGEGMAALGLLAEAREIWRREIIAVDAMNMTTAAADALAENLARSAGIAQGQNDLDTAENFLRDALALPIWNDAPPSRRQIQLRVTQDLAGLMVQRNEFAAADTLFAAALEWLAAIDDRHGLGDCCCHRARIAQRLGNTAHAAEWAAQAVAHYAAAGAVEAENHARELLAILNAGD